MLQIQRQVLESIQRCQHNTWQEFLKSTMYSPRIVLQLWLEASAVEKHHLSKWWKQHHALGMGVTLLWCMHVWDVLMYILKGSVFGGKAQYCFYHLHTYTCPDPTSGILRKRSRWQKLQTSAMVSLQYAPKHLGIQNVAQPCSLQILDEINRFQMVKFH